MKIPIPKIPAHLPFFMLDIDNFQLITSVHVPTTDITTVKSIVLSEQPIPGLSYAPIHSGGMGNERVSFTLPLIKRDNIVGNVAMLKQFEMLRNPSNPIGGIINKQFQFTANPKVLFNWGIGTLPLIWYVSKCDATHKQNWTNGFGQPMYSEIQIELILDEANILNKAESVYRQLSSYVGQTLSIIDIVESYMNRRPY